MLAVPTPRPPSVTRRPRPPARTLTLVTVLLGVLVLLLALPSQARAHTFLTASEPAMDAEVVEPVDAIVLTFSRPIQPLEDSVVLEGPSERVPAISLSQDRTVLTATVDPALGAGAWTVHWRILAQDSHPREGRFTFTVSGQTPETAVEGPETGVEGAPRTEGGHGSASAVRAGARASSGAQQRGIDLAASLTRIALYLGLMAAAGLALFTAWPHRGQVEGASELSRWTAVAAGVALVAGSLELVTHVASVSGRGLEGVLHGATWTSVMRTDLRAAVWLRTVGLLLLVTGGWMRGSRHLPSGPGLLNLAGAVLAIASFQFVGHTASQTPELVVRAADAVHAFAAATWIGGIVGLVVLARHGGRRGRALAAGRFSTVATYAIIGVAAAGSALATVNLPTLGAVWSSAYGQILVTKLVFVGVLAALGAYNHLRVVPSLVDGDGRAHDRLRLTVGAELVLVVVVLALTALLVNTSPPAR